jgi:hypothetical protein
MEFRAVRLELERVELSGPWHSDSLLATKCRTREPKSTRRVREVGKRCRLGKQCAARGRQACPLQASDRLVPSRSKRFMRRQVAWLCFPRPTHLEGYSCNAIQRGCLCCKASDAFQDLRRQSTTNPLTVVSLRSAAIRIFLASSVEQRRSMVVLRPVGRAMCLAKVLFNVRNPLRRM